MCYRQKKWKVEMNNDEKWINGAQRDDYLNFLISAILVFEIRAWVLDGFIISVLCETTQ